MKILVAYASKHGSTAEISRSIAEILRQNGHSVDALSVDEVGALREYEAVILGSALYAGRWMTEAVNFLKTSLGKLKSLPLYLFSSGPVAEGDASEILNGFIIPETVKELCHDCQLKDIQIFHGKIDIRKLSLAELMLFKSVGALTGDYRRWDVIKLWAQHISDELVQAQA